jgi:CubicO group peptidase (beta-lactamase class C family)
MTHRPTDILIGMGQDESMVVAAPESIGLDPTQMRRAREVLREHVDSGRSPGLVAIVVRRGEIALAETLGVRDADHHPMDFDTTFPIASATKPLTATVIMSLVEEGRVGLMQRVADYLPEIPVALRDGLLVHHLLTHTGGYEAVTWSGRFKERLQEHEADDAAWGRDRFVNAYLGCIPELEIVKPPGVAMVYANLGYEMLGEIIRRVTGQSVGDQMRTRVFEPLGMINTAMCAAPELRAQMVGPMPGVSSFTDMSSLLLGIDGDEILTYDSASGGVVSTPADYATFGRMFLAGGTLHGERVLSPARKRHGATGSRCSGSNGGRTSVVAWCRGERLVTRVRAASITGSTSTTTSSGSVSS